VSEDRTATVYLHKISNQTTKQKNKKKVFIRGVKLSHVPILFSGVKGVRVQRNPLNILNVIKPLLYVLTVMPKGMKGFIQKRSPLKILTVSKTFYLTRVSKYIKENKLDRSPMNVNNVVKDLQSSVILKGMKEFIP
jgi:hypothetical protein